MASRVSVSPATTLQLHNVFSPSLEAGAFFFWKACRSVETLNVLKSEALGGLLMLTRMLRLKHLNKNIPADSSYSIQRNWGR